MGYFTHCKKGHEYTAENTYTIPSTGGRLCKKCNTERNRVKEKRETVKEQFDFFAHPEWCACDTCYVDDRIPPVTDESWVAVTAPVLEHIDASATGFDGIREAFRKMPADLVLNCVAWLSFNDKIDCIDGKWTCI